MFPWDSKQGFLRFASCKLELDCHKSALLYRPLKVFFIRTYPSHTVPDIDTTIKLGAGHPMLP